MNLIKTGVLFIFLTFLLLITGALIGGGDPSVIMLFFFIALAMNFFGFWFSDKLVLSMSRAKQVSQDEAPELHSVVDEQVYFAGIPKPKVFIMDSDSPNAFATGRSKKNASIAVTTGIMRILNRDELGGVIAHELAHVGNRDTLIMTMVAAVAGAIYHDSLDGAVVAYLWRNERPARWRRWRQRHRIDRVAGCQSSSCPWRQPLCAWPYPAPGSTRPTIRARRRPANRWPWPAHWQSLRGAAMRGAWTYPKSALSLFLTCSL